MNSLNFTGGLSRDAEPRFTAAGDAITSFSVSLTSGYGDKKVTSWMNCSIFGKRGESVAPYLKKGTQVAVSGEFCARTYTNKDGLEKISLDVRVNDLTLIGGKSEPRETKDPEKANGFAPSDDFDDDIPFN